MPYLSSISFDLERDNPFPYNVQAIKFCKHIDLSNPVTFIIGDNGTGKSTLLETLALRLQLPHMLGSSYASKSYGASKSLVPFLNLDWKIDMPRGFFFRAEDFGDLINKVGRENARLNEFYDDLRGSVPHHIIQEMKDNANYQLYHMRTNYGQEIQGFSHGEAYLKIMQEKINNKGIFILDEPEAALSPSRQLSLLYFIQQHLKNHLSQFIIATHAPILMALPGAAIYEVTAGGMTAMEFKDTEHYSVTKSFLDNPEGFLRHLSAE